MPGTTLLTRSRNHATDWRACQFKHLARAWELNPKRQPIVGQATNYQGRTMPVALLTDDLAWNAAELIRLSRNYSVVR